MSNIPIYIPTLISDINYNPAKVYPRLYFYNGQVDCEPFWMEYKPTSGSTSVTQVELSSFPYVDHYNVVTGSFPSQGSKSLLFQNENPVYGASPTSSLYSDYWETYINLLYDPKTRLINCSGIIPLAEYYKMELNDIVEWRGNLFHLRAINDYDLKTGKCKIQLLGPIIADTFGVEYDCNFTFTSQTFTTSTTSTTTAGPATTTSTTTTTAAPTFLSASMAGATSGSFTSGSETWAFISYTNSGASSVYPYLNVYSGNASNAKVLLIGGGGAGGWDDNVGNDSSGGGGAGQVVFLNNVTISSGSYEITVGAGGAAPSSGNRGGNGTLSSATTLNAGLVAEFGAGGGASTPNNDGRASTYGSGGGGAETGTGGYGGQSLGGNSNSSTAGGGGGGAGGSGNSGNSTAGGNGGAGLTFTGLTDTTISVGGGGAGSGTVSQGSATAGGGAVGNAGSDGTGGGGGGSVSNNPGKGGGGRFILTYQIA